MKPAAASRFVVAACVGFACGASEGPGAVRQPPADPTFPVETTTDPTPDPTVDPGTSETGTPSDDESCAVDDPCPEAMFCAAPNADGSTVGVGEFICGPTCVATDDPGRWCLDDASCCADEATCELGFCRVAASTDGPGTESSTGSDDTSGSTTSESSSQTSESSSESSSGTSESGTG